MQRRLSRNVRYPHDGAVHVDVLAGGHLWMKACADFEEGGDTTSIVDSACGWGGNMGACVYKTETVLFANINKFYSGIGIHILLNLYKKLTKTIDKNKKIDVIVCFVEVFE